MGMLNGSGMDRRFFHRLGASRLDRTICSAAGGAGIQESVGARYGMEPEQFQHSKLIIAWGANILGTNVHLWPFIVEARRNGAKFYVIDPVVNRTGKLADKVFPIHPGSDLALALGLMHVLIRDGLCDREFVETVHDWVRFAQGAGAILHAGTCGRANRHTGRRHHLSGTRVRDRPSCRHPAELRRSAQRARRIGGAGDRAAAGADWRVPRGWRRPPTFDVRGIPFRSAGFGAA